ncbi:phosphonate C-P lyase system protein PhnH [Kaistia dalseonensis]|uniref:Alpha-D-ribose 1-methylphosphonate 5-triphosphate synthase subunit PhnH n=1 Tax=Kaistia dalseonensis TaxID=410840 RepID=A0ABU0H8F5_9HYPH|nr:phosphonate C-P lyase system protein PhnH [Kaistia dalseonensis]MCX5495991.1 phosphonate C-P lyase system protein PhnH [Kaistia dalseonensis]MDQ0438594.1 alpha-D-ribose 1-methylphosphonate 5-triphosphate synthase subunit PhnH [Kaistia dalseonensis]
MSASTAQTSTIATGFADPVIAAQANFHAAMTALSRPGTVTTLSAGLIAPEPLTAELAAVALTLADHETTLWLDPALAASAEVVAYLRFHTGVRIVAKPRDAAFALVVDLAGMPALSAFAQGTDEYPDRSTTIIAAVQSLDAGRHLELAGPGIAERASLSLDPWPSNLTAELAANRAQFPRGIDLVFVSAGRVAALPRTTSVSEG